MENLKYFITPIICALIGWFTNYVAVKMLFHPRKEIKIFFLRIQGIFPKRQKELALNLGEAIERDLISHDDIQSHLNSVEVSPEIEAVIEKFIDAFLKERLVTLNPMIAMFMTPEMVQSIKSMMSEEIHKVFPELKDTIGSQLENSLDFKDLVKEKVEKFNMDQLENILFSIMKKEFKFIELAGAALGFLIGVIQALIFYFA